MSNDSSKNEQIRQKCLKCLKNLMQIFIQAAKMEEEIFISVQNYQK